MSYASTVKDGSARDEALKRRRGAVREVLGTGRKPARDLGPPAAREENPEARMLK